MAPPKVFTGARAIVSIGDPNPTDAQNGANVPAGVLPTTVCGTFDNVSYAVVLGVQPAFILGAFAPAELGYTHSEPVAINASAWRVIGAGPHVQGHVPTLQELLLHEYLTFTIIDRQTGNPIANIVGVRPTGYNTNIAARALESMNLSFVGLLPPDDETTLPFGGQAETPPIGNSPASPNPGFGIP